MTPPSPFPGGGAPQPALRVGSLFSGYGGLDQAVRLVLGGQLAWVSDIDPGACAVLAHHHPDVPNLGDVSTVDWTAVEPVDVLAGGFPCQDVSLAGRRAGLVDGTRSGLWTQMARAIDALRPRLVVIENVREDCAVPQPLATWNRARGVWETTKVSLCGHSELFSETWPTSGMTQSGVAYEQPMWAPPTDGSASSSSPLLPTPDTGLSPNGHGRRGGKLGNGRQSGASLDAIATNLLPTARDAKGANQRGDATCLHGALLPTPTVSDANGPGPHGTGAPDLRTMVLLLPTPQTRDGDSRGASHPARRKELQPKRAGQLDEVAVHLLGPGASTAPPSPAGNTSSDDPPPTRPSPGAAGNPS